MNESIANSVISVRGETKVVVSLPERINQSNIDSYINQCNSMRINELMIPMIEIKKGFWQSLNLEPINFATPYLLEHLACGNQLISVDKLRELTYFDNNISETKKNMFWEAISQMSENQKKKFIQFFSGIKFIPANVTFPFLKVNNYNNRRECFKSLELPNYSSTNIMLEKLLTAMEYGCQFGNA